MLDTKTSERLQLKEQLDLKECILIVKQAELQASQNKELYNTSRLVNRVQYSSQSPRSEGSLRPRSEGSQRPRSEGSQRGRMNVGTGDKCGFCGLRSHPRDQCPAGKSKCRKCKKSGHWATVCRSSKVRSIQTSSITLNHVDTKEWLASIIISEIIKNIEFLIDSGADITCVPKEIFDVSFLNQLQVSDKIVTGPSGVKLKVLGTLPVKLSFQTHHFDTDIYVMEKLTKPILGRAAIVKLNVLQYINQICPVQSQNLVDTLKDNVMRKFPRIFKDVGTFKTEMNIKLVEGAQPFVQSVPRVVPIPLLKPLEEELERLQKLDIIEPIDNPTEWGHLGVVKCRERAKLSVWWIGLSTQIENLVRNCPQCVENRTNSKEPFFKDAFPNRPWQKIALDLFKSDSWYLIVTDYYSRSFEIFKMTKMTESVIIEKLRELFSRYGISETVRSDNGPQFQTEFKKFAFEYDFCHITSSPYFPQSNGCIEAAVKIAKNLIKKNDDIYLALLSYRTTPLECGLSPSDLLYGRKLRTPLPVLPSRLNENINSNFSYTKKEGIAKYKSAKQFDKRHRTSKLSDLAIGDYVWVTDLRVYGKVIKILDEPRSYLIESINSGVYRRNRWHLVPAPYYSESTVTPRWAVPIDNNLKNGDMLPVNREPQVNIGTENLEDSVRQDAHSDVCAPNVSQEEQQDISASVFSPRPKRLIQKPTYLNDYIPK
ncbi:hypothetical protein JTB14_004351 [Gonioctena quinquepunctata]|nr:hypothetical protein JTB14_004351 [Gonioctena quinquepunctata]